MIVSVLLTINLSEVKSPAFPVSSRRGHIATPLVFLLLEFTIHNHGASFAGPSLLHSFLSVHSSKMWEVKEAKVREEYTFPFMLCALLILYFSFPIKAVRMKIVPMVAQNGFDNSDPGEMRQI